MKRIVVVVVNVWIVFFLYNVGTVQSRIISKNDEISVFKVFHWNPHWQCFSPSCKECAEGAVSSLNDLLSKGEFDFANVIEFEYTNYTPPNGISSIAFGSATCGMDWDTLFYDATRWHLVRSLQGCVFSGRSFVSGLFKDISNPQNYVTVVGGHFPQTYPNVSNYNSTVLSLKNALSSLNTTRTIFMADTNTEGTHGNHSGIFNISNRELMIDLGLWPDDDLRNPPASPLFQGCCLDDNFEWEGDRIVFNFGDPTTVESEVLFNNAESTPWVTSCKGSEFHKGVTASVYI